EMTTVKLSGCARPRQPARLCPQRFHFSPRFPEPVAAEPRHPHGIQHAAHQPKRRSLLPADHPYDHAAKHRRNHPDPCREDAVPQQPSVEPLAYCFERLGLGFHGDDHLLAQEVRIEDEASLLAEVRVARDLVSQHVIRHEGPFQCGVTDLNDRKDHAAFVPMAAARAVFVLDILDMHSAANRRFKLLKLSTDFWHTRPLCYTLRKRVRETVTRSDAFCTNMGGWLLSIQLSRISSRATNERRRGEGKSRNLQFLPRTRCEQHRFLAGLGMTGS